jgi:hypothetical protein
MTAATFAITGKLYVDPDTAASGGTRIQEIEEQTMTLSLPSSVVVRRTGIGRNSGFTTSRRRSEAVTLSVPLRDQSSDALRILMDHLSNDGEAFHSFGGVDQMRVYTGFALVIRPGDSEKYFYAPSMSLSTGSDQSLAFSREAPLLSANFMVLIANKIDGYRAWMYDTAENINTHYELS